MVLSLSTDSPAPSSPVSRATTAPASVESTSPSTPIEFEYDDEDDMSEEDKKIWEKLEPFMEKVMIYSRCLKEQMEMAKANYVPPPPVAQPTSSRLTKRGKGRGKRTRAQSVSEEEPEAKRIKVEDGTQEGSEGEQKEQSGQKFQQSALITGATLKEYQLEGVAWMVGLFQNGISGILADEMGLGKTLQTIAFHAYLRERSAAPFMVVCPLSVLNNWADEFEKFAPQIPVCIYHGTREERAEIRRTQMVLPEGDRDKFWLGPSAPSARGGTRRRGGPKASSTSAPTRSVPKGAKGKKADNTPLAYQRTTFPVVLTTYEVAIKDRAELGQYKWGFIVVDEGHRLKNMDCKLVTELKKLDADARMVLTGTPLHNNLAELWSLLNFVLPGVFTDLNTFQEWFTVPTTSVSSSRTGKLIDTLHSVLRPFLLRRLKSDVESSLPPKKEYVLNAPLSVRQREVYDAILDGHLRAVLMRGGKGQFAKEEEEAKEDKEEQEMAEKKTRAQRRKKYDEGNDREYFKKLANGDLEAEKQREKGKAAEELGREWQFKAQLKKINNLKLQNTVMQLRKVCSHPFLFDWPVDPKTQEPILNHELVSASGKMMLLDQLLEELFRRKHKVLLFSQFTTMLDIIEDWAVHLKGWPICRIDGSTKMEVRKAQVERFQNGGDDPEAPNLFLLSTRAGGLGLNLVAADTVIFYDQDWNPQMDLQAQDRAHRIGQTKPVLIFRLLTAHTIETKIMQRATEKRKLEALVIAKGKFRTPTNYSQTGPTTAKRREETMAEMAANLLRLEGERIQIALEGQSVISRNELDMLLDRSAEVFTERGKGWTSGKVEKGEQEREQEEGAAAFAVYEAPVDVGGDALAGMMGEPLED